MKMPSESKTKTKTTRKPITKLPKRKKTSENDVYTDFGHDKMIIFKSFLDEYSYKTPYLQHCIDKKTV
jgi:hypothetical protein